MPRPGPFAAMLICCGPALAAPDMRVSLPEGMDISRPVDIGPPLHPSPPPFGVPLTWESLRDPAAGRIAPEICDMIGRASNTEGPALPFDRANVMSTLLDAGLCAGDAG